MDPEVSPWTLTWGWFSFEDFCLVKPFQRGHSRWLFFSPWLWWTTVLLPSSQQKTKWVITLRKRFMPLSTIPVSLLENTVNFSSVLTIISYNLSSKTFFNQEIYPRRYFELQCIINATLKKKSRGCNPVILATWESEASLRQEDHMMKASLGYIVSSRPAWEFSKSLSQNKTKKAWAWRCAQY